MVADKHRQNISLDPETFEEFCRYAGRYGIKISTWINLKMREFVEEEREKEAKKRDAR